MHLASVNFVIRSKDHRACLYYIPLAKLVLRQSSWAQDLTAFEQLTTIEWLTVMSNPSRRLGLSKRAEHSLHPVPRNSYGFAVASTKPKGS